MPPVIPNPAAIFEFKTQAAFEKWLEKHHASATEVWIKVHKKASGLASITTAEALDVALCWGWIDAIRKSFDEQSFLQRYTPRQKRSPWSLINTQHVARLIDAKRMQTPGHAQIEAAKSDGRWQVAYSGSRDMKTPADLMAAIDANPKARALYDILSSQNRYALAFRIVNLKTEAARVRKIGEFVAMLARGETFYPNRVPKDVGSDAAEINTTAKLKVSPPPARKKSATPASKSKASAKPAKKSAAKPAKTPTKNVVKKAAKKSTKKASRS